MGKKIIIGNMKTNMNYFDIENYIHEIEGKMDYPAVILLPTSLYVPYFKDLNIKLGLQNIFFENEGAYTGEILPKQAKSMGLRYSLVGHSERRKELKESNQMINKKIKAGLQEKMGIILCIGETLEEKVLLETEDALKRQIFTALKGIDDLKNIVIAYEPVWSIGTGKIPTERELVNAIKFIKNFVKEFKNNQEIKVLYGGSVSSSNIEFLNKIEEIDGYLIGGSSCDPEEFLKIIEEVKSLY